MFDEPTEDKKVCSSCLGEDFLRRYIRNSGSDAVCSYCQRSGRTLSIGDLAGRMERTLNQHFYRTATEPDGLECAMIKEADLDWERKGESLFEIIQQYMQVGADLATDVAEVLAERNEDFELAQMGEEQRFGEDARYAESDADDTESQISWAGFENSLKTEARYFSRTAEWTLKLIFEGISAHQTKDGRPVVVDVGPGTSTPALFRARVFESGDKLAEALKRPDKEIGPPPSRTATAGRMNPHGISVLYGALDPNVALAEVRPPVGSRVVVGRFEFLRSLHLLDLEALRDLNVEGSVFDPEYLSRLQKAKFLRWLSHRITMPVMRDDEPYDYLPTQAIADFLASNANPLLHGILYPSVQSDTGKNNVVLFHKAARVSSLDVPDGTEIHASLGNDTEDGPEINYWVWEETPSKVAEAPPFDSDLSSSLPDPPGQRDDQRECVLRLDPASIEIYHVTGVSFHTTKYPVRRSRSEKRTRKF
jgi:hypothetical protein